MASEIIYIVRNYYQLEGIPAYPSYFTPVDFLIRTWIDSSDINRIRIEKYFTPRLAPEKSGIEYYTVGKGSGGTAFRREYWDSQIYNEVISTIDRPILDFSTLREKEVSYYRQFMEKAKNGEDNLQSIGIEVDEIFGDVNVISKNNLVVTASDLYYNNPLIIEYRYDVALMRLIDLRKIIIVEKDGGIEQVLHSQFRLMNWNVLETNEIPEQLFDNEYITGL